ncbi:unnamed protein product [Phytophthora fragariaefolia]|uniref:Unnamed protein product n=1 Tax=Phytophthora fragariaefolia TaxID=1490495 RepID=A0A9W6YDB7_9STRA|nr:unnamed protein product [Phytophthora fragariaefolia]
MKELCCDNAKELLGLGETIKRNYGMECSLAVKHTPEQNGVAERMIRTSILSLLEELQSEEKHELECRTGGAGVGTRFFLDERNFQNAGLWAIYCVTFSVLPRPTYQVSCCHEGRWEWATSWSLPDGSLGPLWGKVGVGNFGHLDAGCPCLQPRLTAGDDAAQAESSSEYPVQQIEHSTTENKESRKQVKVTSTQAP